MDTSVERARAGLGGAKTRHGLTRAKLRELQPGARAYKVSDGGSALYVVVSPSGSRSFRCDHRLGGRRETLTIGRHEPVARHAQRSHLAYGMDGRVRESSKGLGRCLSNGQQPIRPKRKSSASRLGNQGRTGRGRATCMGAVPTSAAARSSTAGPMTKQQRTPNCWFASGQLAGPINRLTQ